MAGVSKISFKGKEIFYVDYSGMKEPEMIQTSKEAESIVISENKPVLLLSNISGAFATAGFMKVSKEVGKNTKHLMQKSAIVGITGAKRILLAGYNAVAGDKTKPFDTLVEAKEYLVKP